MLSFGEFFGESPEAFVTMVERAYTTLQQVAPRARMSASIHLGNYPNLRVQYAGRTLLYYFGEIQDSSPARKAEFSAAVLEPLARLAEESRRIEGTWLQRSSSAAENPWLRELSDGLAIQPRRAKFIEAVYRAVLAVSDGNLTEAQRWRLLAAEEFREAEIVVARRHASLFDPVGVRWLNPWSNPSLYQYGYLNKAHTLCYWGRELAELDSLLGHSPVIPDCFW